MGHLVVSLYHCVEYSLVFSAMYLSIFMHLYLVTHFLSLDDSIYLSKYDGPAFGCAILVVVVVSVIAVVVVIVVVGAAVVILPELCCCLATNSGRNGGGGAGLEGAAAAGS